MALIRLRLSTYLQEAGITPAALAAAVQPALSRNTVYRLLRQEDTITRLDFPTLSALITALRQLTGRPVDFADLLELDENA